MNDQIKDWREELASWQQDHPHTMPGDMRQLRDDFIHRFPLEWLGEMTLEQYAGGKPDGFCYWLETKTEKLGRISSATNTKFGVYLNKGQWDYNKSYYTSLEEAFTKMKRGIVALTTAAQKGRFDSLDNIGIEDFKSNRNMFRGKLLYLYFPDTFVPCFTPDDLQYFLNLFGEQPQGDLLALNRQLLRHLQNLPEFAGFDTQQMLSFLYDCFSPKKMQILDQRL